MLDQKVDEWISTLRQDDQDPVRTFLSVTLEYLAQHHDFLKGSGFYVVGSAFTGKTFICKMDYFAEQRKAEEELKQAAIERFGTDTMERFYKRYDDIMSERFGLTPCPEYAEISAFFREGRDKAWDGLFLREHYEDIDLVIAGLPMSKTDRDIEIWTGLAAHLKDEFPAADHPEGFGCWEIYTDEINYMVSDYRLAVGTAEIHFMIYVSDERFGSRSTGPHPTDHSPSQDVSLKMWKKQQAEDGLPFLTVAEFE
ncbi:hypothetical protein KY362_08045 [Candidatus Woesearchaeota archaeon]|nr:hypothetical protein [Candidatus Woesearchaeota archaeon]